MRNEEIQRAQSNERQRPVPEVALHLLLNENKAACFHHLSFFPPQHVRELPPSLSSLMLRDNPRPHKPAPPLALHTRRVHTLSAADGRARVKLCPRARLRMLAPPFKNIYRCFHFSVLSEYFWVMFFMSTSTPLLSRPSSTPLPSVGQEPACWLCHLLSDGSTTNQTLISSCALPHNHSTSETAHPIYLQFRWLPGRCVFGGER